MPTATLFFSLRQGRTGSGYLRGVTTCGSAARAPTVVVYSYCGDKATLADAMVHPNGDAGGITNLPPDLTNGPNRAAEVLCDLGIGRTGKPSRRAGRPGRRGLVSR